MSGLHRGPQAQANADTDKPSGKQEREAPSSAHHAHYTHLQMNAHNHPVGQLYRHPTSQMSQLPRVMQPVSTGSRPEPWCVVKGEAVTEMRCSVLTPDTATFGEEEGGTG